MRLEKSDRPDSSGRYRNLMMAALAATAFNVSACGPGSDTTETDAGTAGTAGSAGEGGSAGTGGAGGTGGVEGGTGGTGGDAGDICKELEYTGLASKVFQPGETGSFEVNLGDQHPDKAYNGMKFTMPSGEVLSTAGKVVLEKVTYDNYQTGYNSVGDVSGVRPVVLKAGQDYVPDGNGGCTENYAEVNTAVFADPAKRPTVESPASVYATVFKVDGQQNESLAPYALLADRTRFELSALYAANQQADYIMGNSKPAVTAAAFRDAQGFITVDLAGTTDENDGSANILGKLGLTAPGVTFAPIPGEPGRFKSTAPSALTSLSASVAGANQSLTDDTAEKTVEIPAPPEISNLEIDCDGDCMSAWPTPYPLTFTVSDALNCTANAQLLPGGVGTPGLVSTVYLNGQNGSFEWTSGSTGGDTVRLALDCDGIGGSDSEYLDIYQH